MQSQFCFEQVEHSYSLHLQTELGNPSSPSCWTAWSDVCQHNPFSWLVVASLLCNRSAWPLMTPDNRSSQYSQWDLEKIKSQAAHGRTFIPYPLTMVCILVDSIFGMAHLTWGLVCITRAPGQVEGRRRRDFWEDTAHNSCLVTCLFVCLDPRKTYYWRRILANLWIPNSCTLGRGMPGAAPCGGPWPQASSLSPSLSWLAVVSNNLNTWRTNMNFIIAFLDGADLK